MSDLFEDKNISPMLMYESTPFDDKDYIFELKLDGIRCIAYIDNNSVILQNKRYKDVTAIYPELADMCKCVAKRLYSGRRAYRSQRGQARFFRRTEKKFNVR